MTIEKPMKGTDLQLLKEPITYPKIVQYKLDGLRCIIQNGEVLTSSLKKHQNINLINKLSSVVEFCKKNDIILDGELYTHEVPFPTVSGNIRSHNQPIHPTIKFYVFDILVKYNNITVDTQYQERLEQLNVFLSNTNFDMLKPIKTKTINSDEELNEYFKEVLADGYEGLMLKNPEGKYKFGKATAKSQDLLKKKPFVTFDAKIVGIEEEFSNDNESFINEMGKSVKRNTKANKSPTGKAAKFVVQLNSLILEGKEEVTFEMIEIKPTLTAKEVRSMNPKLSKEEISNKYQTWRKEVWDNKESYIGKHIEFKGMLVGAKEAPRHPSFVKMRPDKDIK